MVYAVIRRSGFDGDEAADLFQDVWLAAWDGLASLRDERRLAAWLATVAARRASRAVQAHVRHRTTWTDQLPERADPEPLPDEIAVVRERGSAVREAVAALPERDQRIVEYFFYDPTGLSYADIAARLGVSPDTVGPLRTRCLRRLREALASTPALQDAD